MIADEHDRLLSGLLARLGWQRTPGGWTIHCRDRDGRRARLVIELGPTGVSLMTSSPGPWQVRPLDAGRLRGAIREALLLYGQMDPQRGDHA